MPRTIHTRGFGAELRAVRSELRASRARCAELIARLPARARPSGLNLADALALRRSGQRLRQMLAELGLSTAGSPVAVQADLDRISSLVSGSRPGSAPIARRSGERLLSRRAHGALGPAPQGLRRAGVRIMVTAPEESAHDPRALEGLLKEGVTILRINCARGNAEDWKKTIANLRRAERRTGAAARVMMDLAGPKVRTVAVEPLRGRSVALNVGDRFLIAAQGAGSTLHAPLRQGCAALVTVSEPSVLEDVRPGERLLIDDGKIGARILGAGRGWAELLVERARAGGSKLRAERSLNFPDTRIRLEGMTSKDREDLSLASRLADLVGLSFVKSPEHIAEARTMLEARNASGVAIVLKIENRAALERLDELLFEHLRARRGAVLIARGDLAAEVGFEQVASVQSHVALMAHAAHMPVILATQILERMVRTGLPSRAELGDLAFAAGIDCLLLNKGPHVREAARFLRRALESISNEQTNS